jgi:hypothetical protein
VCEKYSRSTPTPHPAYYAFFLVSTIAFLATGSLSANALVAIPGLIIIIVSFAVGYWKMRAVVNSVANMNLGSSEATRRMKRALGDIRAAALAMCLCMSTGIICLLAFLLLGGYDASHPDRSSASTLVAIEFAWMAFSVGMLFASLYIDKTVRNKVRTTTVITSNGHASNRNQPNTGKDTRVAVQNKRQEDALTTGTPGRASDAY